MHLDRFFDEIYVGFNVAMAGFLIATIGLGVYRRHRADSRASRASTSGAALLAVGTGIALGGGLIADAVLKATPWFQQVRFGLYDIGFTGVVWGTIVVLRGCVPSPARARIVRALVILFALSLVVGAIFVFIPATFVLNRYHEQVQLVVYWLPLLVASAGGCLALLCGAAIRGAVLIARMRLMAAFEGLLFLGLLRESEILPDLGDPLVNLLVSFVPFVAGAVFLTCSVVREGPHLGDYPVYPR